VPALDVEPFATADVEEAGSLLAAHVANLHRSEPLVPVAYEREATATEAVAALWRERSASGVAARRDGRLVGYLLGHSRDTFPGPNVWVPPEGQCSVEPELVAPMYAEAAQAWVDSGRTAHYALLPAKDAALVDVWFHLCFGLQHVHAATELTDGADTITPDPAVTVRRATADDVATLVSLDVQVTQHMASSPVLSDVSLSDPVEAGDDWREALVDPTQAVFVAEADGRPLGAALACPVELSSAHAGLARPDHSAMLAWIVVDEPFRGRGLSRPLADAVLVWARTAGFHSIVTDWRSANLESARSWRRFGFRDTYWRLHRNVGW